MFKKVVIAGLLITLFIEKCNHIVKLKSQRNKLTVREVDGLLGCDPDDIFKRIAFKSVLYRQGHMFDGGRASVDSERFFDNADLSLLTTQKAGRKRKHPVNPYGFK